MTSRLFRSFRFNVQADFRCLGGFSAVEIKPDINLHGPGIILLETALKTNTTSVFQQLGNASTITVDLFAEDDDRPSLYIVMSRTNQAAPKILPFKLEASSADIVTLTCEATYDSLDILPGNSALELLATVR